MPKKKQLPVEFVDAGEMSRENYESVVEMLTRWFVKDLNRQATKDTESLDREKN